MRRDEEKEGKGKGGRATLTRTDRWSDVLSVDSGRVCVQCDRLVFVDIADRVDFMNVRYRDVRYP